MANTPIPMSKLKHLLKLHHLGRSKLEISTITGVSRNTIKKYLAVLSELDLTWEELSAKTDHELDVLFCQEPPSAPDKRLVALHAFFETHDKRLRQRGMTLTRLYEIYSRDTADYFGKTAYYKHYRIWKQRTRPSMRIEHKAGDKVFVDYAGERLEYIDPTSGEVCRAEVFVAILGASQLTYVEATASQKVEDFISSCQNALHYFGGAPTAIVTDNLKSAVIKSHRYEPKLNENFEAFADHYGMAVLPARAYKPKDKALVEGAVKITYTKIYAALPRRLPVGLEMLNERIAELLKTYNTGQFSGRDYSRLEQFRELEEACLQPLPQNRFELRRSLQASVAKNGHINLGPDKHYYSVPYAFIGKKVRVFYNNDQVEVFYRHQPIARHKRVRTPYQYTTDQDHLASHHQVISEWSPEYFRERARAISPEVEHYISMVLLRKQHPEHAFKSCQGILGFARRLGPQRLIKACRRADSFGLYHYKAIEEILKKGLDLQEDASEPRSMPAHNNIRGKDYYASVDSSLSQEQSHD